MSDQASNARLSNIRPQNGPGALMEASIPGHTAQTFLDRLYDERQAAIRIQEGLEGTINQRQFELADINRAIAGINDAIKSLETSIAASQAPEPAKTILDVKKV